MKIIRVVPFLDFGGIEKRVQLTAEGFLKENSVNLTIVVLGYGGKVSEAMVKARFDVRILNENPKIPNFSLINRLITLFKELKPDVIHASGSEANFHGLIAGRIARIPVRIGEEVGFPQHDWKWRMIFRFTYRFAHKVIGISEAVKGRIVELDEIANDKVVVVYNPVALEAGRGELFRDRTWDLKQIPRNNNSFVFVTTGRLVQIKNLDLLIRVFSHLVLDNPDRKLELWMVGDGPEKENLLAAIRKVKLVNNVMLHGYQENVFQILNQADAFILPSFSEGFSISLVEAMYSGLPCIATKIGGPSEIINSETGYLIDPNDSTDILDNMQNVIDLSENERLEMGRRAKEDVEKRFSVEKYVKDLINCYQTSLN